MTLEELATALGLDTDENKDKYSVLKKEFNAKTKNENELTKKVATLNEKLEASKKTDGKLESIKTMFDLDFEAEDFDAMLEEAKEKFIKDSGGGATPEEIKSLKRELTKTARDREKAEAKLTDLTNQLAEEKHQRINQNKLTAIRKALTENKIVKPEQMVDLFANRVNVDEDETTFTIKGDDGSELSIPDYIADWAKDNPEFVTKDVKGGAGSLPGNSINNKTNKSETDVDKLMSGVMETAKKQAGDGKSLTALFG